MPVEKGDAIGGNGGAEFEFYVKIDLWNNLMPGMAKARILLTNSLS
jgi:hypothetical protein